MTDKFNLEAAVNFTTQNSDSVISALEVVKDLVVALGEAGKIPEKTMRSLFRSIETQSKRAAEGMSELVRATEDVGRAAGSAASEADDKFTALGKRVSDVSDRLREAAELLAGEGISPTLEAQMDYSGVTSEQIEEAKLYFDALKSGAQSATQEMDRQAKERERIVQQEAQIYRSYLDQQQAHEVRVQKEKEKEAERQSQIYRKYLDQQQAHEARTRKDQERIYRDYLDQQQSAAKKAHDKSISDLQRHLNQEVKEYEVQQRRIREIQSMRATQNNSLWEAEEAQAASNREAELGALKQAILARHTEESNSAIGAQINGLPRLRYAMYDVAQTTGILTAAIGGLATGLITASAQYETAFTAVERTSGVTGDAVGKLRDDFLQLAREIPQTFAEIANIGARGAQLGIATDQLQEFTEVVAQFVATSDTVTLDQAVEAFGRISNLLGDTDFNRIGSAITLVGVNAAATEAQIIKTTQELAPFATAVGLSTEGVIALATALGSLGQPPERARSAFLTLQRVMDNAIASGSDNLYAFANLLNKTAEETAALWQQDPDAFITAFARSLGSVENLTTAFADLGINERRAVQVFQALAADARNAGGELSVLERAMQDSAQGYAEGTELARQYGLIVDDLASKWQIFKNSVMELSATMGDVFAPIAKQILDLITPLIQTLTDISKNPAGVWFIRIAGVVAGVTFVVGSLVTTLALATASIAGMRTALHGLTGTAGGSAVSLRTLSNEMRLFAGSVRGGTTALRLFRTALISTGVGLALTAIGSLALAFTNLGDSSEDTFNKYITSTAGLTDALAEDFRLLQELTEAGAEGLEGAFSEVPLKLEEVSEAAQESARVVEAMSTILGQISPTVRDTTGALEEQTAVIGTNTEEWLKAALLQSDAFQELASNDDFIDTWVELGADFDEVLRIAREEGEQGVINYFIGLANASQDGANAFLGPVRTFLNRVVQTFQEFGKYISVAWNNLKAIFTGDDINWEAPQQHWERLQNIWTSPVLVQGFKDVASVTSALTDQVTKLGRESRGAGLEISDLGEDLEGLGDSSGGAAGKLKELREEIRTVLDYSKDLQGVFTRAFDIRFGVSIAQDSTANMLQKLRDEAEAAEQRIRDLRVSLRDLRSELGLIDADISKTQYFLSIAIEYGDTQRAEQLQARLAKLEADRARTQEDLRKTQNDLTRAEESNSKAVQGNTQAARDNRAVLQDLFQSYRDQIVAAAEAGASQKELEELSRNLREEFVRQATQLGYNRDDLKLYEQAFEGVTLAIDRVPRNVTLEISGLDAAEAALLEFFTKLEADARKAGENAGNSLGTGIGSGLGGGIPKTEEESLKLGNTAAYGFNLGFGPVVDPVGELKRRIETGEPLTKQSSLFLADSMASTTNSELAKKYDPTGEIQKALRNGEGLTLEQANRLGQMMGVDIDQGTSVLQPRLRNTIPNAISSTSSRARTEGDKVGRETGSQVNQGTSRILNFSSSITRSLADASYPASISASNIASTIASNLSWGISYALDWLVPGRTARSVIRSITGFAEGGYTGRGGKYEPAGIVHKGEYVIPKHMVNQSTGLPYADALGRLVRGTPSPAGYANGGYVRPTPSSPLGSTVSLSAGTIQQIAMAVKPHLIIDGKMIAEAVSRADAGNNRVGAN